jgi:hypothetical protein
MTLMRTVTDMDTRLDSLGRRCPGRRGGGRGPRRLGNLNGGPSVVTSVFKLLVKPTIRIGFVTLEAHDHGKVFCGAEETQLGFPRGPPQL